MTKSQRRRQTPRGKLRVFARNVYRRHRKSGLNNWLTTASVMAILVQLNDTELGEFKRRYWRGCEGCWLLGFATQPAFSRGGDSSRWSR